MWGFVCLLSEWFAWVVSPETGTASFMKVSGPIG